MQAGGSCATPTLRRTDGRPAHERTVGGRNPAESLGLAVSEIPYAWSSFWGRFGYGQIPLPDAIYTGALIVSLIGLVGLIMAFVRKQFDRIQIKQIVLVIFSALLFATALFGDMLSSTAGPMGRFYFPGLSAFGLLLALGWTTLFTLRNTRYSLLVSRYAIPVAAFALALIAFFGYFVPAYAAPQAVDVASISQPLNITFDGKIELLGAEVDRVSAQPGIQSRSRCIGVACNPLIETMWNSSISSMRGIIVAQRDTWPGRGMYPTTLWKPGEVIADTLTLNLPNGAYAPNNATLQVGLYQQDGSRLNAIDAQGQASVDNAASIGTLKIDPRPGAYPNSMQVNFGDRVEFLGYEMSPRSILPGEAITVTLFWRATAPFAEDYSVFLNALRPTQRISAQDSSRPLRDTFSTKNWTPGQVITDVRVLQFPPTAKPGELEVEVGWFLPKVGRLNVLAEDGHEVDTRQLLSKIRVREK